MLQPDDKHKKTRLKRRYNPSEIEEELIETWQKENAYSFNSEGLDEENLFIIDTPPPYTNAGWHIGGAIHYSQIDIIARAMRALGKKVMFQMGLDRNGLPIEIAAENKFGVSMHSTPRQEFLNHCQSILEEFGASILDIAKRLGMSCNSFDWDKIYKTDDPSYRALTQATFIDLWNKELIYEDDRPSNWDTVLRTTISDSEVVYREMTHTMYEVRFKVEEETYSFATTRPELIPAIRLIIYHPDDHRYAELEGKLADVPLVDEKIPIMQSRYADPDLGTGLVQICSFGDVTDIRILRELCLPPRYVINTDGTMTAAAGKYQGLDVLTARTQIVSDLKDSGDIQAAYPTQYRQPTSDRTGAPIEFLGVKEYYLKQMEFTERLFEYAESLHFTPSSMRQVWKDWLERIQIDWPISRRRVYGTEIPVWYCSNNHPNLPEPGRYYRPWAENPPFQNCSECGDRTFRGEERTFDTWMDSSISTLYIIHHAERLYDAKILDLVKSRGFLADLRPQGKDIIRTWLHYTMLRIEQLYGLPAFRSAWISGHVVTHDGTKMSKRLGNSPDPLKIINKFGADTLRLYGALEGSHGSDLKFTENKLAGTKKLLNKVYNIGKFVSQFEYIEEEASAHTDKWIKNRLGELCTRVREEYIRYNFNEGAKQLRKFITDDFSSHYMEMVKSRLYNSHHEFSDEESRSGIATLHQVFRAILGLLSPITPFLSDYLFRRIYGTSVNAITIPEFEYSKVSDTLIRFNQLVWKTKKENTMSLRDPIRSLEIPRELEAYTEDLVAMHNILSKEGGNLSLKFGNQILHYSI